MQEGSQTWVDLILEAPRGERVPAGRGQGHWQTLGIPEGLLSVDIRDILQDRAGYLWFGTDGGGVSRYDGREFVNFTTADGLAHDRVECMVEDRAGHLWFGTAGEGVSWYDGAGFVNFTTADGLPHDRYLSIAVKPLFAILGGLRH